MRIILFLISLTIVVSISNAQNPGTQPKAKLLTRFNFRQFTGGVIVITARLNDIPDSLNFILDTGSGGISLDSATCAEFKIPHVPSGRTINGIAGIRPVDFAKNNQLRLPGLSVEHLDFYINDYDILSSVYGVKIDGIIGYSFFSRYIVAVNFDSSYIEVYQPGTYRYPESGYLLHPIFNSLPIESLKIKDARTIVSNFYMDTGAGLCFLVSTNFANDSSIFLKKRKPVPIQAEGLGGRKQMQVTVIKQVKLGPYSFRRVPTHILDDEYNATSYPYLGGLIGNDILRRFNIVFNYPYREIHLLPNSHYREAFDYSYTGLSIYYTDGKIVVDDVIKGSPASIAGFQKDDVVLAVNNNFSNSIMQYKNLLQVTNDKVKVLVLRDNKPLLIHIKVGTIF